VLGQFAYLFQVVDAVDFTVESYWVVVGLILCRYDQRCYIFSASRRNVLSFTVNARQAGSAGQRSRQLVPLSRETNPPYSFPSGRRPSNNSSAVGVTWFIGNA
jgi:hypothetical protein